MPMLTTTEALAEAVANRNIARRKYSRARTIADARMWDEDLNFWIGRVSMLEVRIAQEAAAA